MRNRGHEYRERLGPAADGRTLEAYLATRYRHSSAAEWRSRIAAGLVRLDCRPARPDVRLKPGQLLAWRRPPWVEPAAPSGFAVLYRDAELLAVAKPAGLPTLPGAGFLDNTLLHRVRSRVPGAAAVHRLGRWTSGVVLFALTRGARAGLTRQWAARTVVKRYRALAAGRPRFDELEIDAPIGPVPHAVLGTLHAVAADGRPAQSRIRVVEQRRDTFLCEVHIVTGRPHQVRIHLAAAGHPLVGDPLYVAGGLPAPGTRALPGDPGYRLHAASLTLDHPGTLRSLTLSCAPPPPLRRDSSW